MPRFRRDSTFGPGPRAPMCRERRAQFRAKLRLQRRPGRITPCALEVGRVLVGMIGQDGRLDPSIDYIVDCVPYGRSAVLEALDRLEACGFVRRTRRLRRDAGTGWRCEQTSNSYVLALPSCESGFRPGALRKNLITARSEAAGPSNGSDEWARWNAERQLRLLAPAKEAAWEGKKAAVC